MVGFFHAALTAIIDGHAFGPAYLITAPLLLLVLFLMGGGD